MKGYSVDNVEAAGNPPPSGCWEGLRHRWAGSYLGKDSCNVFRFLSALPLIFPASPEIIKLLIFIICSGSGSLFYCDAAQDGVIDFESLFFLTHCYLSVTAYSLLKLLTCFNSFSGCNVCAFSPFKKIKNGEFAIDWTLGIV